MRSATATFRDQPFCQIGLALGTFMVLVVSVACPAQAADGVDAAAIGSLAKGFRALYDGEPKTAASAVERLLVSGQPSARLQAAHVKARSLWAVGDQGSRSQALGIWKQIAAEAGADKEVRARLGIARSLELSAAGKDRDAIAALESATTDAMYSSAGPELAVELAILHAKGGDLHQAKAILDAATKEIEKAETYGIPKPIADAFAAGIRTTRGTLGSPALALFLKARGFQRERQYPPAIATFTEVSIKFPGSDEDHQSQFEIGSCHVGMNQPQKALDHWKQFVAGMPGGPWRGQAFLELIDMALVDRLDVDEAVAYAQQAKLAMADASSDAAAASSWSEVGYPLSLRLGIVALCREQVPEAVAAFEHGRRFSTKGGKTDALDALLATANNPSGLVPKDCRTASSSPRSLKHASGAGDAVPLALSLGVVFHVAGEPEIAATFFDRVAGAPATKPSRGAPGRPAVPAMASASPVQAAFAFFGRGMVFEAEKQQDKAAEAFAAALRAHGDAPWHDETLFRLAMVTSDPGAAMPSWKLLVEKFPESPRRELALYRCAKALWLHAESLAKKAAGSSMTAAGAAKVDQAWEEARGAFAKLADAYPDSPYAGEAFIKQIDIGLERTFDLAASDEACRQGIAWFDREPPPATGLSQAAAAVLPVWAAAQPAAPEVLRDALGFRLHVAAGLVAHLQGRSDEAVKMFSKASQFDTSRRQEIGAETSMKRMISVVEGRGPKFSPHDMLESFKNEKQRTGVLLADLALLTFDSDRAGSIYERILGGQPPFGPPSAELEAYLILRMGQALEFQKEHEDAVAMLTRLYDPKYAKYSWASDGIFRLGTWNHNMTQKAETAMPHWEHVFTKTPDHPEAERSLFYFGLAAKRHGDHAKAAKAMEDFLRRYPASLWTVRVRDHELPEVKRLLEEARR